MNNQTESIVTITPVTAEEIADRIASADIDNFRKSVKAIKRTFASAPYGPRVEGVLAFCITIDDLLEMIGDYNTSKQAGNVPDYPAMIQQYEAQIKGLQGRVNVLNRLNESNERLNKSSERLINTYQKQVESINPILTAKLTRFPHLSVIR